MLFNAVVTESCPGVLPKVLLPPTVIISESDDEATKRALAEAMKLGTLNADNMERADVWFSRFHVSYARARGE